jgi:Flp pilus assembly protein TadD
VIVIACLLLAGCATSGGGRVVGDSMHLGYKAARRGYWQEALERFRRANAAAPDDVRVLNNLAVALEAVGRYEEALATYESALAIAPNDRSLKRNHESFKEFYDSYILKTEPGEETGADDEKES